MAQVQGEEIYLSHSGQEVDDNIDEVVAARGSEASLSARLADIVSDFEADQQRQETEIGVVAAQGAKNLLKNVRTTTTHRGITFTVNEDGSVTASGTNDGTGASLFNINAQTSLALPSGDYILTGCPAGGSETGYFMDVTRTSGSSLEDTGSGVGFTVGGTYTVNEFRIVISRNITVDNLTFYPMIRRAEITDDSYAPYAPTNRELYEKIESDVVSHELVVPSGSILSYVNTLDPGFYTARQGSSVGTDKPISNGAFAYLIFVFSSGTAQITAFEAVISGGTASPDIFTILKAGGTWGSWHKFTGAAVASAQSAASLMQAGRLDTAELTDAQEVTENDT